MRHAHVMAALALVCLGQAARADECRLARVAELPFEIRSRHLVVAGKINGNDATLIFDTGADFTYLTEDAAGHLNLRAMRGEEHAPGALGAVHGVGGGAGARAVEVTSMDFGGLRSHAFALWVIDQRLALGGQALDGLLSPDILAKYDIDLDFQSRRIRLYYPHGDCTHPSAYLHGNLFQVPMLPQSADHSPRIPVQIGGAQVIALIDTGSDETVVSEATARRLNLPTETVGRTSRIAGIGSKIVEQHLVILPSLGIGDIEMQNVRAAIAPVHLSSPDSHVDMILGMDQLHKIHPWLSYSSGTFIFQYPPAPSPD